MLKPLRGSGGQSVFVVDAEKASNLNQMIEAIGRDGYVIAQAYVPAAKEGDIRFFLINGVPLMHKGKYAALRRVAAGTTSAATSTPAAAPSKAEIGDTELEVAELVRPKLVPTACSWSASTSSATRSWRSTSSAPATSKAARRWPGVDFSVPILEAIERKVAIAAQYARAFDNRHLAIL